MSRPIRFLRHVAFAEAISYLVLLFVAMPLKYLAGIPIAVMIAGSIHGALFVVFLGALTRVVMAGSLSLGRLVLVFVASLVPFVPFFLDRRMRDWEAA
jgi:integral membrane protein